jgi:hypothetical protein
MTAPPKELTIPAWITQHATPTAILLLVLSGVYYGVLVPTVEQNRSLVQTTQETQREQTTAWRANTDAVMAIKECLTRMDGKLDRIEASK